MRSCDGMEGVFVLLRMGLLAEATTIPAMAPADNSDDEDDAAALELELEPDPELEPPPFPLLPPPEQARQAEEPIARQG